MFLFFFLIWVILNGRLTAEIAVFGLVFAGVITLFAVKALGYSMAKERLIFRNLPLILHYIGVLIAAPDFNCLNVRIRKEYYWEHLGMMDDEAYVNKNIRKIEKYTLAKGFDESRLILTFETARQPLNTRIIEEKIRRYLI